MPTSLNNSGIRPICFRVLVAIEKPQEKSAGGIIFPDDVRERKGFEQARGTVVAKGAHVFDEVEETLDIGARVVFPKYEGTEVEGKDGNLYRLIDDKHIIAVEDPAPGVAHG